MQNNPQFDNPSTKQHARQQYRPTIQITKQILEVIINGGRNGVSVSTITRDTRTGHNSAIQKCQKLVDVGLLRAQVGNKTRRYYVTEDGIQFYSMLCKYVVLLQTIAAK